MMKHCSASASVTFPMYFSIGANAEKPTVAKVRAIRQKTPTGATFMTVMVISIMTSLNWLIINMDGTSIMQGVAVIFIAEAYGIHLTPANLATVVVTATLASIGTAGIPSVGLVTLAMVLNSVGLPTEGIALIMGIDRILDMLRTAVNITGDAVCTTIVSHQEKALNREVFNRN